MTREEGQAMNRIYELRAKEGWSLREVERKTGITYGSINAWENGKGLPRIDLAYKLAQVFGVSIEYMMGWEDGQDKD